MSSEYSCYSLQVHDCSLPNGTSIPVCENLQKSPTTAHRHARESLLRLGNGWKVTSLFLGDTQGFVHWRWLTWDSFRKLVHQWESGCYATTCCQKSGFRTSKVYFGKVRTNFTQSWFTKTIDFKWLHCQHLLFNKFFLTFPVNTNTL